MTYRHDLTPPDLDAVAVTVIEHAIAKAYDITVGFHATVNDRSGMPVRRLAERIGEALGREGILPAPTPAPLDVIYASLVHALGKVPVSTLKHIHEVDARESITRILLEHAALNGLRMIRVEPFVWNRHFNPPGPEQHWKPGFRADAPEGTNRFDDG